MYTIGQVSELFNIPVSTLRYYDKEGLFPSLERSSGIRRFSEKEIEALRIIECLKKTGMEIKDIKQFMELCAEGSSTYSVRRDFFLRRKEIVEEEIRKMNRVLDMIDFKCWYYEQAIKDGNEDRLNQMIPDNLPDEIKDVYDRAHL
ncbi:MAG: MerR family transcriptional regulator [Anaerovoracaceae bacterium]